MTTEPGGVLRLEIAERLAPVFDGRAFGRIGTYQALSGTIHGELDPAHALNAGIVNLDKAPRNEAGRVAYRSEFTLMTPTELANGNGWLLYDVVNRGNKVALTRLNRGADGNRPTTADHAGDGFLMRHGFSLLWSAWQCGVPAGADRLDAHFPTVAATGINRDEFIAEGFGPGDAFIQETSETSFIATLSYRAAELARDKASLTVRQRERDARATPQGLTWRYVDDRHIEITRPPGFDRGAIYEFIHPARDPEVMGIGFAAIRDLVAFLRHDTTADNPLRDRVRHTLGFGISQSGRVLRDMVHLGFNQDLDGRPVFDAIFPVVSGSRRTFINFGFAQPGRYSRQHEDHAFLDDQFPFTYPTLTDPLSGQTDGIMRRAAEAGVRPKVMHLDADSDIWAARASLVATDPAGRDVAMPDDVRIYLASATQHAVHKPEAKHASQLPGNPLGYSSWMRALLIALTEWVEHGTQPPASEFPSHRDGSLATREAVEEAFPRIPGVRFPDVLNALHLRDHSVEPPIDGPEYPVFVNAVDADGNARGGLRHPVLAAPLGTHTGWAVRIPGYAEGDLFTVQGSYVPFAATEAERSRAGDPRPSIEARYASHAAWASRVIAAAEQLVAQRLLLREDADRFIAAARESGLLLVRYETEGGRVKRDSRGLDLATDSERAVVLSDRAVDHYLKYHADTMSLIDGALEADPGFVLGHCIKGQLLLGGANPAHRPLIDGCIAAAEAGAATATPRERRHLAALAACRRGAYGEAFGAWRELLDADPTDLFALRVSNVTYFRYGQTQAILDQADRVAPSWSAELPGYECFQSVWAFAHEEVGDNAAAERAIDDAYPRDHHNFFAHHVKAHILGAEGRPREGADWLAAQTGYWPIGSNLVHHLWWHQALMLLDVGERDAVLASYDENIRNLNAPRTKAAPAQYNDLQNAAALLWRLEVLGLNVGSRWEELGEKAEPRIEEPAQPLLSPHLMMALAATGRDAAAARLLAFLRVQASDPEGWEAAAIGDVVVSVCEAVLAHRRGDHARVVALLAPRLVPMRWLGGSAAQRDVFRQVLTDSAVKAGARDVVAEMLAEETAGCPAPLSQRAGYAAAARWLM